VSLVESKTPPNHGLHPTRLSRLDFDIGFVIVSSSGQSGTLQSRLAGEARRAVGRITTSGDVNEVIQEKE
jgi:hypothetical protein